MAECASAVGEASQPWTNCQFAKPYIQQLRALYQSSTLVGDVGPSFESLVAPLRAISVPVATSVSNPNFQQGVQEFNYIKAYLVSLQNTMSRHGGAAIADHGSLGSQQNPGPVLVCNPVFNHYSPGLLRPDNHAMGQYDGGRRDRPDSKDRFPGRHYVRSDWSGHLDVGQVGGRQGVEPIHSSWMGQMPIQHGQAFHSSGPGFVFPNLQQSHSSNSGNVRFSNRNPHNALQQHPAFQRPPEYSFQQSQSFPAAQAAAAVPIGQFDQKSQVPKWQHGILTDIPRFSLSKKTTSFEREIEKWLRPSRKRKPEGVETSERTDGVETSKRTDKKRKPADPESANAAAAAAAEPTAAAAATEAVAAALEGAGPADSPALEYAENATEAAELSMEPAAAAAATEAVAAAAAELSMAAATELSMAAAAAEAAELSMDAAAAAAMAAAAEPAANCRGTGQRGAGGCWTVANGPDAGSGTGRLRPVPDAGGHFLETIEGTGRLRPVPDAGGHFSKQSKRTRGAPRPATEAAAMAAAAELSANCRGTGQRGAGGHGGEDQASTFNASPALAQVRQCPRRLASAYAAAVVRQPFKAFIVPRKDGYPRSCTEAMDAGQVEACSVSCTWDGTDARLKELRSAVMQKTCWRGFTLLRRLKDLTPDVSRLWVQGMQMHPARKYELVLFKNTAKPNGDVDPGDQSKTACQLCDAEDPSLQLLQLLIKLLLPGYKIGSVQDVLNGSMALEAYVISELGSRSGQPEHTDSAPEMAIAQH